MTVTAPRVISVVFAAGVACGAGACSGGSNPQSVLRHSVALTLDREGVLDVREHITARFAAGGAVFERRAPPARFDDVLDLRVTLDGRQLQGDQDIAVVRGGRSLFARWTFPATTALPHEITLSYRVNGGLAIEGRQRRLTWRAFEPGRGWAIEHARVELRTPLEVAVLMPSGMAEAGWQVATDGTSSLVATRDNLPAAESGTLLALLAGDALPLREPRWQFDLARADQLAPAFVSGGAFIIVVALGIVLMLWRFDRRHPAPGRRRQLRVSAAVVGLAGALCSLVAALLMQRFGPWPHAIGLGLVVSAALFFVVSVWYPRASSREPRA